MSSYPISAAPVPPHYATIPYNAPFPPQPPPPFPQDHPPGFQPPPVVTQPQMYHGQLQPTAPYQQYYQQPSYPAQTAGYQQQNNQQQAGCCDNMTSSLMGCCGGLLCFMCLNDTCNDMDGTGGFFDSIV